MSTEQSQPKNLTPEQFASRFPPLGTTPVAASVIAAPPNATDDGREALTNELSAVADEELRLQLETMRAVESRKAALLAELEALNRSTQAAQAAALAQRQAEEEAAALAQRQKAAIDGMVNASQQAAAALRTKDEVIKTFNSAVATIIRGFVRMPVLTSQHRDAKYAFSNASSSAPDSAAAGRAATQQGADFGALDVEIGSLYRGSEWKELSEDAKLLLELMFGSAWFRDYMQKVADEHTVVQEWLDLIEDASAPGRGRMRPNEPRLLMPWQHI